MIFTHLFHFTIISQYHKEQLRVADEEKEKII